MAKIPQGILGGLKGRVGNIVGGDWKGINYIRSMPLSVANPNTTLQQAQRGAFTQVVLVARLLLANLVATYWDPFARGMSGYNSFIKQNIGAFLTSGLDVPGDFYSGRGILTGVKDLVVTADDTAGTVTFTWVNNSGLGDALATDEAVFLWYNVDQDYWYFDNAAASLRSAGTDDMTDSTLVTGDTIEGYMFFVRPDVSKISDSSHDQVVAT